MDLLYEAYNLFNHGKYENCSNLCDELIKTIPDNKAVWYLKLRSLTKEVYVDELEVDVESIADISMDTTAIAKTARKTAHTNRPITQSGRPITGFIRQETSVQGSKENIMKSRMIQTGATARPFTSSTGRLIRMATASSAAGKFQLNISRMDFEKMALQRDLSKAVFEYLFYFESDIKNAVDLASKVDTNLKGEDWWWKVQIGKCYFRLGMFNEAGKEFSNALSLFKTIDIYLYLSKLYARMSQPTMAKEVLDRGLEVFPNNINLLTWKARIDQDLGELQESALIFRDILKIDATHVESISCIATEYFYNENPQVSVKLYRRLLQMGVENAEVYCNIGLCCFMSQEYDLVYNCFERSLAIADDEIKPDVYYNIGMLGLYSGDISFARHCFSLAVMLNPSHVEALNNLGVIEIRNEANHIAYSYFTSAADCGLFCYEPFFNIALFAQREGEFQTAHMSIQKSLQLNPEHYDSTEILLKLEEILRTV